MNNLFFSLFRFGFKFFLFIVFVFLFLLFTCSNNIFRIEYDHDNARTAITNGFNNMKTNANSLLNNSNTSIKNGTKTDSPTEASHVVRDNYYHVVQPGETINSIADKYEAPREVIMRANNLDSPLDIKPKLLLLIPVVKHVDI